MRPALIRRIVARVAAIALPFIAAILIIAGTVNAAVVPNQYKCSRWTGKCVQVNGPHVNGLPNACYWSWSFYSSGYSTSICTYWP